MADLSKYDRIAEIWDRSGCSTLLYAKYREEIEGMFNLDGIKSNLESSEPVEDEFNDTTYKSIYVGSCFALAPSGKYYMPYAHSNVSAKEALKDEIYWEAFNDWLEEHDLWFMSGEGDPTDVFICQTIEEEDNDS
jgi:hypothetical protein